MSDTSSYPYKQQAKHNELFHSATCAHFPADFYDWKITILFYAAIHYVKALGNQLGIDVGNSHLDIRNNIKPPDRPGRIPSMPFNKGAYGLYDYLYRASQLSRYNGIADHSGIFTTNELFQDIMKEEHLKCVEAIEKLKMYLIKNRGLTE